MGPASSRTETAFKRVTSGTTIRRTLSAIEAVDSDEECRDRILEVHEIRSEVIRDQINSVTHIP